MVIFEFRTTGEKDFRRSMVWQCHPNYGIGAIAVTVNAFRWQSGRCKQWALPGAGNEGISRGMGRKMDVSQGTPYL